MPGYTPSQSLYFCVCGLSAARAAGAGSLFWLEAKKQPGTLRLGGVPSPKCELRFGIRDFGDQCRACTANLLAVSNDVRMQNCRTWVAEVFRLDPEELPAWMDLQLWRDLRRAGWPLRCIDQGDGHVAIVGWLPEGAGFEVRRLLRDAIHGRHSGLIRSDTVSVKRVFLPTGTLWGPGTIVDPETGRAVEAQFGDLRRLEEERRQFGAFNSEHRNSPVHMPWTPPAAVIAMMERVGAYDPERPFLVLGRETRHHVEDRDQWLQRRRYELDGFLQVGRSNCRIVSQLRQVGKEIDWSSKSMIAVIARYLASRRYPQQTELKRQRRAAFEVVLIEFFETLAGHRRGGSSREPWGRSQLQLKTSSGIPQKTVSRLMQWLRDDVRCVIRTSVSQLLPGGRRTSDEYRFDPYGMADLAEKSLIWFRSNLDTVGTMAAGLIGKTKDMACAILRRIRQAFGMEVNAIASASDGLDEIYMAGLLTDQQGSPVGGNDRADFASHHSQGINQPGLVKGARGWQSFCFSGNQEGKTSNSIGDGFGADRQADLPPRPPSGPSTSPSSPYPTPKTATRPPQHAQQQPERQIFTYINEHGRFIRELVTVEAPGPLATFVPDPDTHDDLWCAAPA